MDEPAPGFDTVTVAAVAPVVSRVSVRAMAGLVVGGLALTGLLAADHPDQSAPARRPPIVSDPAAAAGFLDAWRAHLLASWSANQVDERVLDGGTTLRFETHEAQRPPDSIRAGGGTVSARRRDTLVACATAPGADHPECREARAPRSWGDGVAQEVAVLRRMVSGTNAVYGVTAAGGCFQLTLLRPEGVVPVSLGRGATYCIDRTTGVVVHSTVRRVGAVDTVTTVEYHAPARDGDLALPDNATYR